MANVNGLKRTLTTSALLALAACAPKRSADTTTLITPASARPAPANAGPGPAAAPDPEVVRQLVREHNHVGELINGAGMPNAKWTVPMLAQYREWLNRMDEIQVKLAELEPRSADQMDREGHRARLAAKQQALNEYLRPPRD